MTKDEIKEPFNRNYVVTNYNWNGKRLLKNDKKALVFGPGEKEIHMIDSYEDYFVFDDGYSICDRDDERKKDHFRSVEAMRRLLEGRVIRDANSGHQYEVDFRTGY